MLTASEEAQKLGFDCVSPFDEAVASVGIHALLGTHALLGAAVLVGTAAAGVFAGAEAGTRGETTEGFFCAALGSRVTNGLDCVRTAGVELIRISNVPD